MRTDKKILVFFSGAIALQAAAGAGLIIGCQNAARARVGDDIIDYIESHLPPGRPASQGLPVDECLNLLRDKFDVNSDNHLSSEELARAQELIKQLKGGGLLSMPKYSRTGETLERVLNNWPRFTNFTIEGQR